MQTAKGKGSIPNNYNLAKGETSKQHHDTQKIEGRKITYRPFGTDS